MPKLGFIFAVAERQRVDRLGIELSDVEIAEITRLLEGVQHRLKEFRGQFENAFVIGKASVIVAALFGPDEQRFLGDFLLETGGADLNADRLLAVFELVFRQIVLGGGDEIAVGIDANIEDRVEESLDAAFGRLGRQRRFLGRQVLGRRRTFEIGVAQARLDEAPQIVVAFFQFQFGAALLDLDELRRRVAEVEQALRAQVVGIFEKQAVDGRFDDREDARWFVGGIRVDVFFVGALLAQEKLPFPLLAGWRLFRFVLLFLLFFLFLRGRFGLRAALDGHRGLRRVQAEAGQIVGDIGFLVFAGVLDLVDDVVDPEALNLDRHARRRVLEPPDIVVLGEQEILSVLVLALGAALDRHAHDVEFARRLQRRHDVRLVERILLERQHQAEQPKHAEHHGEQPGGAAEVHSYIDSLAGELARREATSRGERTRRLNNTLDSTVPTGAARATSRRPGRRQPEA